MKHLRLRAKKYACRGRTIFCFLWFFASIHVCGQPQIVQAQETSVIIGTGGVSGAYYPTGKAIAKIVNSKKDALGFNINVETTAGSVFNINAILSGDMEFGIVQSDRQFQAWNGIKEWKHRGPQKRLRSICSFYPESVVLAAGDDTGIETIFDLKGKHVNIGNLGSGARGNAIDALQICELDWRRELNIEGHRWADAAGMLVKGGIDAFFHTIGHPNNLIKDITSGVRKMHFVPLSESCIDSLISKWSYYAKASIPVRFYPKLRNNKNVETFAVKATFCTSTNVPDDVVYRITKQIFTNLQDLKKLHPALSDLTQTKMLEAISTPLHPGATKYYKEAGISIPETIPKL